MHTITSRPATDQERAVIAAEAGLDFGSYGCLVLCLGVVPTLLLGWVGGLVGGFISEEAHDVGRWVGGALGVLIFIVALATFIPFERRKRRRAGGDAEVQMVEEIAVTDPAVISVELIDNNEPILVFDIGADKLLLLQGQWLRDERIYGAPPRDADHVDFVNELPEPYSFPSTAFTVSRLPFSGRVLSIRVSGRYLAPAKAVEALRPEYEFADSELLEGSLDKIAEALAREHARRSGLEKNAK
ncbi:MAG: hypothetical protein U0793_27350 [Gemmataceae bacterium]